MKPPDDFDSVKLNRGGFALSFRDLRYEGMGTPPPCLDRIYGITTFELG